MLLERNVAFDIAGHAFFIEDGGEWDNTLRGNLGMLVRSPNWGPAVRFACAFYHAVVCKGLVGQRGHAEMRSSGSGTVVVSSRGSCSCSWVSLKLRWQRSRRRTCNIGPSQPLS